MQTLTRDEYFPDVDSVVSVLPRSPQTYFPEHIHEFDELVIVRSGSAMNYIEGKPSPICRGSVFLVRARQSHYIDRLDNLYLTNVLMLPSRFKHVSVATVAELLEQHAAAENDYYVVDGRTLGHVESLLNRISEESDNHFAYSEQMIELLLSQLMIELWRGQPEDISLQNEKDTRLTNLLRYLNAHYQEEIDWETLANKFDIPLRTLSRKVTDITGMPPNSYLLRVRLCRAMRMLKETALTVTEIAFACGFNDSNYFTSRFHREMGTTPLKYRRDAQSQPTIQ